MPSRLSAKAALLTGPAEPTLSHSPPTNSTDRAASGSSGSARGFRRAVLHGGAQENERRPRHGERRGDRGMAVAARLALDAMEGEAARQSALLARL